MGDGESDGESEGCFNFISAALKEDDRSKKGGVKGLAIGMPRQVGLLSLTARCQI